MSRRIDDVIVELGSLDEAESDAALCLALRPHLSLLAREATAIMEARQKAKEYALRNAERARAARKARRPLPAQSAKRKAEQRARAEVRAETLARAGWTCQGPSFGLPETCRMVSMDRPVLEVHEVAQRSTHPGSHLDVEVTVALCQLHHDMVSSPVGELRELVESVGLIVRATT